MKLSTKFPLLIIISGLLAFAYAISAMWSSPALDPGAYVAAHATATAIAPAIYPTQQYNANVLPELQRVERDEITETTRNKQQLRRTTDNAIASATIAWQTAKEIAALGVSVSLSFATVSACVALSCIAVERIKRARAYEPIQRMPDYAWYMPRERQLGDTRSGIGLLEAPPTAKEHAQTVRAFRGVVLRSVVSSFFDAVLRRKVDVTHWQPDNSREIVVR